MAESEEERSLEMRITELEDKLSAMNVTEEEMEAYNKVSGLMAGGGQASAVAGPTPCVIRQCTIVQCIRTCTIVHQCTIHQCTIQQCTILQCTIQQCTIIQPCINECGGGLPGGGGLDGGFGSLGG